MEYRYNVTHVSPETLTDLIEVIKEKRTEGWSFRRISKCFKLSVRFAKEISKM